jgi:hypothetical protein
MSSGPPDDPKTSFTQIYQKQIWNGGKSSVPRSGPGSTLEVTKNIREILDRIIPQYNLTSLLDIGCGDLTWIPQIKFFSTIRYVGIDIVESLIQQHRQTYPKKEFYCKNAIVDALPDCDLIILRDVIFHLTYPQNRQLFQNIVKTKFKYILITSCRNDTNKEVDLKGQWRWRELNLLKPPFNFMNPILKVPEDSFNRDIFMFSKIQFLMMIQRIVF